MKSHERALEGLRLASRLQDREPRPSYSRARARGVLAILLLVPLAVQAADGGAPKKVDPAFEPITDDPKLPRVLLMGDSVSIAYTVAVRKALSGLANVHRVPANCGSTKTALGSYGLVRWLGANEKWDVIHFNHGLHDLSYRFADDSDKDASGNYATSANGGHQNVPPAEYEQNLHKVVARLKQTGAQLIFATTTPVPECDAGKYVKDSERPYNEVARKVMAEEGVVINDLWAAVKLQQEQFQIPRNVHFRREGSEVLGKQVAAAIRAELWIRDRH
jgi:acyl-CoA thioesterase-1